jgi:hypothetical protein
LNGWEFHIKTKSFVKYQIVCSLGRPQVIAVHGPFKGPAQDGTIATETLTDLLIPGEKGLADKQYRNVDFALVPVSGHRFQLDDVDNAWNADVYSVLQTIELIIKTSKRTHNFGCIKNWAYSLELQQKCVFAMCKLATLALIDQPLDIGILLTFEMTYSRNDRYLLYFV